MHLHLIYTAPIPKAKPLLEKDITFSRSHVNYLDLFFPLLGFLS